MPTPKTDDISSETDHNDGGEGLRQGQDVAGASGDVHAGASGDVHAGASGDVNEGDAGPFNISGYQKRLPPGVRDDKYG